MAEFINREKLLSVVLWGLLTGMYYFSQSYVQVGGFDVGYHYLFSMAIVMIGFFDFLRNPRLYLLQEQFKLICVLSLPYVANTIWSFAIWIFNLSDFRIMTRGFFSSAYIILGITMAASLVYLLGERAVLLIFSALTASFMIMVLKVTGSYGASEVMREFISLVVSFSKETGPAMEELENPGFAYAFLVFLIYWCHLKYKFRLRDLILAALALLCFFLGMKRSALLAFGIAMLFGIVGYKCPPRYRKLYVRILCVGMVVFAFFYIPYIRYGFLRKAADQFGIDTSSRTRIYDVYKEYYDFRPGYIGKGLGWIQRRMSDNRGNSGYSLPFYDVHNDYLRIFIELGFWGYLVWVLLMFPAIVGYVRRGLEWRRTAVALGCVMFLFVTYMTENMYYGYPTITFYAVVLFAVRYRRDVEITQEKQEDNDYGLL